MKSLTLSEFNDLLHQESVHLDQDIYVKYYDTFLQRVVNNLGESEPKENASSIDFTGMFDGNGHTIHNIPRQFFKTITKGSVFKNVTLKSSLNLSMSVVCRENNGRIQNVTVESTFKSRSGIGGITLNNSGEIIDCTIKGKFIGNLDAPSSYKPMKIGGIASINNGTITNCTSLTQFTGSLKKVGGIVGYNYGLIQDCIYRGGYIDCIAELGGIAGKNRSSVKNCTTDNTEIKANMNFGYSTGGIVGDASPNSTIKYCKVTESEISCKDTVGGLVGDNSGVIEKSTVSSDTVIEGELIVGGLIGVASNSTEIRDSITESSVNAKKRYGNVGGVVSNTTINSVLATSSTTENSYYIGILGQDVDFTNCYYSTRSNEVIHKNPNKCTTEGIHTVNGLSDSNLLTLLQL